MTTSIELRRWMTVLGTVAAAMIAVSVNILAARHPVRWDVSKSGLYTLSPASKATLAQIEGEGLDTEVIVLAGAADPIVAPLRSMLEAYRAVAPRRLRARFVDPDRERAEALRLMTELDVQAAKTASGHTLTDAQVVIRRGPMVWYLHDDELSVTQAAEGTVRPRMEAALTGALRAVLSGERVRFCFSTGHHEASVDDPGPQGLSALRTALVKDNWDVDSVAPERGWTSCGVVAVMAPNEAWSPSDVAALTAAVDQGASVLAVLSPEIDPERRTLRPHGLDPLLARWGVQADDALVVERDPARRRTNALGLTFDADLGAHESNRYVVELLSGRGEPRIAVSYVRPFIRLGGGRAPEPLLTGSATSFALHDVAGFLASRGEPEPGPSDRTGPLDVAFAIPASAGAGPRRRAIVVGTSAPFVNATFRDASTAGTASRALALAWLGWLGERTPALDVPQHGPVTVALHLTEDELASIDRYALLWLPLAIAIMGGAMALQRRLSERRTDR